MGFRITQQMTRSVKIFGANFGAKPETENDLTNEIIDALVAQLDRARLS